MIIAAILLQAAQTERIPQELSDGLKDQDVILNSIFDCMDNSTKAELKSQISSATAETVTDAALSLCKPLTDQFEKSTETTFLTAMPPDKAKKEAVDLTADHIKKLRDTYISHVDKSLIDPKLADARMKIVSIEWGQCVREKAEKWAALKDEARTVAEAAVTSCNQGRRNTQASIGYLVRSKGWPASAAKQLEDSLLESMNSSAISWVIEQRAKTLGS